jgi:hypothetical protein
MDRAAIGHVNAKASFAFASSKQKRVPMSARSVHQPTYCPLQCERLLRATVAWTTKQFSLVMNAVLKMKQRHHFDSDKK